MRSNRLNDLNSKSWLKFQKSWFVHNPPARRKDVLTHPAKFPETLAQEFIEFFTKRGDAVLDPMAGTGSTLIAALRTGRHSYGLELNPKYVEMAQRIIADERKALGRTGRGPHVVDRAWRRRAHRRPRTCQKFKYVLTSPPYWDMLHAKGAQTQSRRRTARDLDVFYSEDARDVGNIRDYEGFLR